MEIGVQSSLLNWKGCLCNPGLGLLVERFFLRRDERASIFGTVADRADPGSELVVRNGRSARGGNCDRHRKLHD